MKYTYLLINIFTLLGPLVRSHEPKVAFFRKAKFFMPGMIFTALFFLIWDYLYTAHGVWSFNNKYILGIRIAGLPLEELLFFVTVPYACIFIYEVIVRFFGPKIPSTNGKYIVWLVSVAALVASYFVFDKAYTFSVLFVGGLIFPIAAILLKGNRLNIFFIAYALSLIPMFIVNGILTALPVVIYNNAQNVGIRITTIPVEDFLYSAILLVMNIALFEWMRGRNDKTITIQQ